jgi:hypothetical protein
MEQNKTKRELIRKQIAKLETCQQYSLSQFLSLVGKDKAKLDKYANDIKTERK